MAWHEDIIIRTVIAGSIVESIDQILSKSIRRFPIQSQIGILSIDT